MLAIPIQLDSAVSRETVRDASYRWDNTRRRHDPPLQVAQWVWSGEGVYADASGKHRVTRGSVMLFAQPDRSSYWYPSEGGSPWVFSWMTMSGLGLFWKDLRMRHGSVIHLGEHSVTFGLMQECAERFEKSDFADPMDASALVYQFVMSLTREAGTAPQTHASRLDRARTLLQHHRGRNIGVKEVAAECGYSREHFSRIFRDRFGDSPGRLLQATRQRHARSLLRQSSLTLDRVAFLSGFGSSAALCRAFRAETGLSPGEWRRQGVV